MGSISAGFAPRVSTRRLDRLLAALPWVAAVLGAALRTRAYASNQSLWSDEVMIAVNVTRRGFRALLRPLAYYQGAPVGWLWAERAAVQALGQGELALRLVPFLASLLSIVLFVLVARRLLPAPVAALAVLLFAVCPWLIYYSTQTKQYESDVTLVLLMIWLSLRLLESPTTLAAAGWTAGAVVTVWSSHPGLLAVAAAGLGLFTAALLRRSWALLLRVAAAGVVTALAAGAVYVVSLRQLAADKPLRDYWVSGYLPKPLRLESTISWLRSAAISLSHDPLGTDHARWVGVLAVLGLAGLVVGKRFFALTTICILGIAVLAAATAQVYPLQGRAALFAVPVVLLLLAAATQAPLVLRGPGWRPVRVLLQTGLAVAVLLVAVPALRTTAAAARTPTTVADLRQAMTYVARHRQPGDLVLVHFAAALTAEYYAPRLDVPVNRAMSLTPVGRRCSDASALAALVAGHRRLWLLFGQDYSAEPVDRTRLYLDRFSRIGQVVLRWRGRGDAGAYLVRLAKPTVPTVSATGRCLAVQ